jgi:hypothetical protein
MPVLKKAFVLLTGSPKAPNLRTATRGEPVFRYSVEAAPSKPRHSAQAQLRVTAPAAPPPATVPDPPSLLDALRAKAPRVIPDWLKPPPPPDDVPPAARAATASEIVDPPPSLLDVLRSRRDR